MRGYPLDQKPSSKKGNKKCVKWFKNLLQYNIRGFIFGKHNFALFLHKKRTLEFLAENKCENGDTC